MGSYLKINRTGKIIQIIAKMLSRLSNKLSRLFWNCTFRMHQFFVLLYTSASDKLCFQLVKSCNFRKYPYSPNRRFFILHPPSPKKFQLSFILCFYNVGFQALPTPLRNFQWPFMGWVWIFSATTQHLVLSYILAANIRNHWHLYIIQRKISFGKQNE